AAFRARVMQKAESGEENRSEAVIRKHRDLSGTHCAKSGDDCCCNCTAARAELRSDRHEQRESCRIENRLQSSCSSRRSRSAENQSVEAAVVREAVHEEDVTIRPGAVAIEKRGRQMLAFVK